MSDDSEQTETAVTQIPTPYHAAPQTNRSKAPEFYGFVAWTSTSFLFVVYLLWALLPDEYIVALGVDWYPNREWALLLPSYSIFLVLLTYWVYMSLTIYGTPAFDDVSAIADSRSQFAMPSENSTVSGYTTHAREDATPALYDIPIGLVNRVLYDSEVKRRAK
ncbi:phosphatidylinositol class p [Moniliophthora roreri MCA 2997]|uniref:Phosphatidylinositol class p n=2 Tax=Moniliophthora roreri TaxID=221103 RepID=V2WWW2_MONRO|nr:phosphatidylinositol class p [Moniliophthora roreri MCA 2997]